MLLESRRNWCTQWNGWNGLHRGSMNTCYHHWAEWAALPYEHVSNCMFVIMRKCLGGTQSSALLRNRWEADLRTPRAHACMCTGAACKCVFNPHVLPHLFPSLEGAQVQQGDREREKKTKQKTSSADGTDVTNACCLRASEFYVSPLAQTWRTIRGREEKKQMRILGERKVRFWDATAAGPAAAQPGPISRTSKYGAQLSIQRQTEQTISCTRRPSESCAP